MPMSVLSYFLDKVRYSDLETYHNPILFSPIKRLMDEIELNSLYKIEQNITELSGGACGWVVHHVFWNTTFTNLVRKRPQSKGIKVYLYHNVK